LNEVDRAYIEGMASVSPRTSRKRRTLKKTRKAFNDQENARKASETCPQQYIRVATGVIEITIRWFNGFDSVVGWPVRFGALPTILIFKPKTWLKTFLPCSQNQLTLVGLYVNGGASKG